jgi:hypothetical protein
VGSLKKGLDKNPPPFKIQKYSLKNIYYNSNYKPIIYSCYLKLSGKHLCELISSEHGKLKICVLPFLIKTFPIKELYG